VVEGARLESVYAGNRIAGSNPAPSASYYVPDIAYIIVFLGSYFLANLRGLPVSCSKQFVAETVARAISAAAVMKISPAPFRG
jgi:hypothetical protein